MNDLLEHVARSIRERKLLRRGAAIVVATSGGVDSMVLLHLLHSLAAKQRWRPIVAHFNHRLRGVSSEADARFVRQTAHELGLPFVEERADVKRFAREQKLSIEMAARELRHGFLARTARRTKARAVALAHHADDQVELFFVRLLRGAGTSGLAGMKWQSPSPIRLAGTKTQSTGRHLKSATRPMLVRPLLDVSKSELVEYARRERIRFREDASNASCDILRNRIRRELLPLLRTQYQTALETVVLRLMDLLAADTDALEDALRLAAANHGEFAVWPVALQRRALQQQLRQQGVAADYELIESLRWTVDEPISVKPKTVVARDASGQLQIRGVERVAFDAAEQVVPLNRQSGRASFDGLKLNWQLRQSTGIALGPRRDGREYFDVEKVGTPICLRHWRPGDRFQPIGLHAPVKLQDWFVNRKIPRARRHQLVLATSASGEIFWVEGERIGERFKLTPGTRHRLVWRWQRTERAVGK